MKVFVSWSGERSKAVAQALKSWLPDVVQGLDVWMSDDDIRAGARWGNDLDRELQTTDFGILCLTAENLTSAWLLFEAGSLAKTVKSSRVVPYLLGVSNTEIPSPLARFQGVNADENGTFGLLKSINEHLDSKLSTDKLEKLFEKWWPDLSTELEKLASQEPKASRYPIGGASPFEGPFEDISGDNLNKFQSNSVEQLDILGHSLSGLFQKQGRRSLLNALANGATVRVLFLDPTSPYSDQLEQIGRRVGEPLKEKIRESMTRALGLKQDLPNKLHALNVSTEVIDTAKSRFQLAASRLISYANIHRADDAMLVSPYSQSVEPGKKAPTRELLRDKNPDLFRFYAEEFERVWNEAMPIEEILSDEGIYADRSRVLNHVKEIRDIYSCVMLRNKQVALPFPKMLVVLPNMGCEIRCKSCFTWNASPYGKSMMDGKQIDLVLFKSIVDQAIELKMSCIELSGGGEPLEHNQAAELIEMTIAARSKGIKVGVLSNGNQLVKNPELIESILNLDYIRLGYTEYLDSQKDEKIAWFKNLLRELGDRRQDCKSCVRIGVKFLLTQNNAGQISGKVKSLLNLRTTGDRAFVVDHIKIKSIRGGTDVEPLPEQVRRVEHELAIVKEGCGNRAVDVQVDIKSAEVNHETYKCWISPIMSVIDASGRVYLCCNFYERPEDTRIATFGQDNVNHFKDFWGKHHHQMVISRLPVNEVCNSKVGCNCRLVHYQELVEPYVRYSIPVPSKKKPPFPGHDNIL